MLYDDTTSRRRSWQPCPVSDLGASSEWVGAPGEDASTAEWFTAAGDIIGALSGMPLDPTEPDTLPVELPDVLAVLARAATRRLRGRIVSYLPPDHDDIHPSGPVDAPDVCVPVPTADDASGSAAVGHLHLACVGGAVPTVADRAVVDFLAGHAADLAATRRRDRERTEATALLRRELGAAASNTAGLTEALESSRQIGLAMGILIAREQLTPDEAFTRLRVVSQNTNRSLRDVAEDVVDTGSAPRRRPYRADVTRRPDRVELRLAGDLDLAVRHDLDGLLRRLDPLDVPVHCIADEVTFVDSHGLEPIVDAARRRFRSGRPALVIEQPSRAMARAVGVSDAADILDPRPPAARDTSTR